MKTINFLNLVTVGVVSFLVFVFAPFSVAKAVTNNASLTVLDSSVDLGSPAEFQVYVSSFPDSGQGYSKPIEWQLTTNNATVASGSSGVTFVSYKYTYSSEGTYVVILKATDLDGDVNIVQKSVTVSYDPVTEISMYHTSNTHDSITWGWTNVSGAEKYTLQLSPGPSIENIHSNSYTYSPYSPNTEYSARVKVHHPTGGYTESSYDSAYTSAYMVGVTGEVVSGSEILWKWTGSAASYCAVVDGVGRECWTNGTSWSQTGLDCGTNYTVKVKARNGDGDETSYKELTRKTSDCPNNPPAIQDGAFSCSPTTMMAGNSTTCSINTNKVSDKDNDVLSYKITIKDSGNSTVASQNSTSLNKVIDTPGSYTGVVIVSDGKDEVSRSSNITVSEKKEVMTTIQSSEDSVTVGSSFDLYSFVIPTGGGTPVSGLTVDFYNGNQKMGSATTGASDGQATYTVTPGSNKVGTQSYMAKFSGNDKYQADDSGTTSVTVTEANRAPVIESGAISCSSPPLVTGEYTTCSFDTAKVSDPDGDSLTYDIGIYDTSYNKLKLENNSSSIGYTFETPGTYNVAIGVSDGKLSVSQILSITVNARVNKTPKMGSNSSCTSSVSLGSVVSCSISATDQDDANLWYRVVISGQASGDSGWQGPTGNSYMYSYEPPKEGSYTASLQVKDDEGAQDSVSSSFTVTPPSVVNQPPQVSVSAPATAKTGEEVTFTINVSDPNGAADIKSWLLDSSNFAGGLESGTDAVTNYEFKKTFTSSMTLSYMLQAEDKSGKVSNQSSGTIVISKANTIPSISSFSCSPSSLETGNSSTCTVQASDPDDDEISYRFVRDKKNNSGNWATLNETQEWSSSGSKTYSFSSSDAGEYRVKVDATDFIGDSSLTYGSSEWVNSVSWDSSTANITVSQAVVNTYPPSVTLTPSTTNGEASLWVSFTISATDSGPNSGISKYNLDFGNDSSSGDVSWSGSGDKYNSYTYHNTGVYHPSVTVWDNDGYTASSSATISVTTPEFVNSKPYEPSGPTPAHLSTGIEPSSNRQLSWTGGDPDGNLSWYKVYFGETNDAYTLASNNYKGYTTTANMTVDASQENKAYYWLIAAEDYEYVIYSPVWRFTTGSIAVANRAPNEPSNPDPTNNFINISVNVSKRLSWTSSDPDGGSLTNNLYFGSANNKDGLKTQRLARTSSDYAYVDASVNNHSYYWFVSSEDFEYVTEGPVWKFTTSPPVAPSNDAPVLNPIGNKTTGEMQQLKFTVTATDANGDNLAYSAVNLPSLAVLNSTTGEFFWTPSCSQGDSAPSSYNVTFRVDDGRGGQDSEVITITVNDTTSCAPPPVPEQVVPGLPIWRQIIPF